jgi:hypothetical protein
MKAALIVSSILLFTLHAFAETSESIGNESFLPTIGEFFVEGDFIVTTAKAKIQVSGQTFSDNKLDASRLGYALGYGLFDRLSIGVSGNYILNSQTVYDYGPATALSGTSQTYKKVGPADADLRFIARLFEAGSNDIKIDLFGNYSPKMINAISATDTDKGNGGRGGSKYDVGLNFYRDIQIFELKLAAKWTSYANANSTDATTSNKTYDDSAHNEITYHAGGLFKISEMFRLGGYFEYSSLEGYTNTVNNNGTAGTKTTYDVLYQSTFAVSGRIVFTPKSALIFEYSTLLPVTQTVYVDSTKLNFNYDSGSQASVGWMGAF